MVLVVPLHLIPPINLFLKHLCAPIRSTSTTLSSLSPFHSGGFGFLGVDWVQLILPPLHLLTDLLRRRKFVIKLLVVGLLVVREGRPWCRMWTDGVATVGLFGDFHLPLQPRTPPLSIRFLP